MSKDTKILLERLKVLEKENEELTETVRKMRNNANINRETISILNFVSTPGQVSRIVLQQNMIRLLTENITSVATALIRSEKFIIYVTCCYFQGI